MDDDSRSIQPATLSCLDAVFALGNRCFRDEWSRAEVKEILLLSQDSSFLIVPGSKLVGFLLGLPFYIPQIPSSPSQPHCRWDRIENVGRVAYLYLEPEWRAKGLLHTLVLAAERAHRAAGRTSLAATVARSPLRYRPALNLFKRLGYLPFDNFGRPMLPEYDYIIKHLRTPSK